MRFLKQCRQFIFKKLFRWSPYHHYAWQKAWRQAEEITIQLPGNYPSVTLNPESHTEFHRFERLFTKEPETIAWIDAFEPKAVLWDVGANVGMFSVYALLRHPDLRLVALEPDPSNFHRLLDNVQRISLSRAVAYPLAAAARTDLFQLAQSSPGVAGSSNNQLTESAQGAGSMAVTLDALLNQFHVVAPSYIKIDVDGLEMDIVKGMTGLLSSVTVRSILVESQDVEMAKKLDTIFESHGFQRSTTAAPSRGNRIYMRSIITPVRPAKTAIEIV